MVAEERGREQHFASTGRGGQGNAVRSPSRGRPAETQEEAKAAAAYHENQKVVHGGRGGAGNLRSPSRDPADKKKHQLLEQQEQKAQADAIKRDQSATHSSGRGGLGNMAHAATAGNGRDDSPRGRENVVSSAIRSLSRSRSREPRGSSGTRQQQSDKLASVDEASTLNGGHEKHGLASKIASHIPGLGHHNHEK